MSMPVMYLITPSAWSWSMISTERGRVAVAEELGELLGVVLDPARRADVRVGVEVQVQVQVGGAKLAHVSPPHVEGRGGTVRHAGDEAARPAPFRRRRPSRAPC